MMVAGVLLVVAALVVILELRIPELGERAAEGGYQGEIGYAGELGAVLIRDGRVVERRDVR